MPCSIDTISLSTPTGPTGPAIPGFGTPFSLDLPNLNPFPPGVPEDLLNILNLLQLLIPPGALLPQLNLNFGKDIFDAIMKLLDQFMPFLMLYKFFLPILKLILCIIEVICSLVNPFKMIDAIINLFTQCIPAFLALFPIFALIIMIISLLLLILALIEYIIAQVLLIVEIILRNILALQVAFQDNAVLGVLAIAQKLGALICGFQNLFVLLSLFGIIIGIIKDILALAFAIPPCGDDTCCTSDVCPAIIKDGNYTNNTGTLRYFPQVGLSPTLNPPLPANLAALFNFPIRAEMWQLFDVDQTVAEAFTNIYDGYDVTVSPKPTFFPTSSTYTATTDPQQAPYTFDLRLFYNPTTWNSKRTGLPRYIRFTNCIMLTVPTATLTEGDLTTLPIITGVATIAGGLGFEDDGVTILKGYNADGYTLSNKQATLNNFLHMEATSSGSPVLSSNDGYTFTDITYTFKPNIAPLITNNLITLGCAPAIALNRTFVNNVYAGDVSLKTAELRALINGPNFPDPAAAQECLTVALNTLRTNITAQGVADFQATANLCLQTLKDNTNNALVGMVGIGFDPCQSTFTATPTTQFTTKPIIVTVNLNERNGLPLTTGVAPTVSSQIGALITPHITFGEITDFTYDGYTSFTAELTSSIPGSGSLMISFDNNTFCTNTLPTDTTQTPTHTLQSVDYEFVYVPAIGTPVPTADGDGSEGAPRREE